MAQATRTHLVVPMSLQPATFQSQVLHPTTEQGCGNTMPDLSYLVPFHSGQVENFNLLVLGPVQNLYKVAKILYFIF